MLSMTLASLGWGVWWFALVLRELAPRFAPSLATIFGVSCSFAALGFLCGLVTLRARLAWALITCVPLFANASLLVLPLVVHHALGVVDEVAS